MTDCNPDTTEAFALVADLERATNWLIKTPVPDECAPDLLGQLQYVERKLREYRQALLKETPTSEGKAYRVTYGRKATRSFNTSAIVSAASEALNTDRASALIYLIDADALRLSGSWTGLKKFAERNDLALAVAHHEIKDGDPDYTVGEVWSEFPKVEAIQPEKTEAGF